MMQMDKPNGRAAPPPAGARQSQNASIMSGASSSSEARHSTQFGNVTMTPLITSPDVTLLRFETYASAGEAEAACAVHYAGRGQHTGLLICNSEAAADGSLNNSATSGHNKSASSGVLQMQFECLMQQPNPTTGELMQFTETRAFSFWSVAPAGGGGAADAIANFKTFYEFFQQLTDPNLPFPRDYADFIKRIMKQLQLPTYSRTIARIEVEMRRNIGEARSGDKIADQEQRQLVMDHQKTQLIQDNLHMKLDQSYPNVLTTDELIQLVHLESSVTEHRELVEQQLEMLITNGLIEKHNIFDKKGKPIAIGYRRRCKDMDDTKIQNFTSEKNVVENLKSSGKVSPTIGVITNMMCEYSAVLTMMTDKTTYLRTTGEATLFTIGKIGQHCVIVCKLPLLGNNEKAQISSNNQITRLLGAFQNIEHAFIVGVAGSIPNIIDFFKHSRLGDIVVSRGINPSKKSNPSFVYGDVILSRAVGEKEESLLTKTVEFSVGERFCQEVYAALDRVLSLYETQVGEAAANQSALTVNQTEEMAASLCPWQRLINEQIIGSQLDASRSEMNFSRPPAETDRELLELNGAARHAASATAGGLGGSGPGMGGGGRGVLTQTLPHPVCPASHAKYYPSGVPAVRTGVLGCCGGQYDWDNDAPRRNQFANQHQLLAFDQHFDSVISSLRGSGVNSFYFVRGIADYVDGTQGTQWQPYASLAAAAFLKCMLLEMPAGRR